jgi:hypothetical protein
MSSRGIGNKNKRRVTMWERNEIRSFNEVDVDGNPTGGSCDGIGLQIHWQDGPLGRPPKEPNGAFVDDVIEAARQRLEFYQTASNGRFACRENAIAITKLEEALHWLYSRRMERDKRGVQGLHKA